MDPKDPNDVIYVIKKIPEKDTGDWSKCKIYCKRRHQAIHDENRVFDRFIEAQEEILWGIRMNQCDLAEKQSDGNLTPEDHGRLKLLTDRWHIIRNQIDPQELFLQKYPELPKWMQFIIRTKQRIRKAWRTLMDA